MTPRQSEILGKSIGYAVLGATLMFPIGCTANAFISTPGELSHRGTVALFVALMTWALWSIFIRWMLWVARAFLRISGQENGDE